MTGRVIVVGSVNVDLVAQVPRLPSPGETVTGAAFSRHQGGKGGNQAVAAARLGARTVFVGAVGDDDFGAAARHALEIEGVDVGGLRRIEATPTGVALILVDSAENVIAVASGANGRLSADDVAATLARLAPGPADVVLVGHEIPTVATRAALLAGRATGARTILNPAPADDLDRPVLRLADILVPNRTELARLVASEGRRIGRSGPAADVADTARSLLQPSAEGDGVREAVVVTLGPAGAVLVAAGGAAVDVPAPAVAAVDTVGAGDAFVGALAAALASGIALEAAVRRATVAGSLAVTREGAREGMPTAAELEAALDGSGVD